MHEYLSAQLKAGELAAHLTEQRLSAAHARTRQLEAAAEVQTSIPPTHALFP